MKNLTISAIVIASVASAGSAFAGTTTNTITNGWETGTRNVEVDNVRVETGDYINKNMNMKIDSVTDGGTATSTLKFDGTKFTGTGFATTGNVDPWVNGGFVDNIETGSFSDITKTSVVESVEFGNTSIEYKLEAY